MPISSNLYGEAGITVIPCFTVTSEGLNTSGYKPSQISINTYGWFFDILNERNGTDGAVAFIREYGFEAFDYNFERFLPSDAVRAGEVRLSLRPTRI